MKYNSFLLHHLSIYYMLLACFYNSIAGTFAKILAMQIPAIEVVLFRNLLALFIILYIMRKNRKIQTQPNRGGHPWMLATRGVIGILGLIVFFYNLTQLSLGEAFTFQKTAPIFIAVIAYFALKEKLSKFGWFAVFLGFVGIVLVIQPHFGIHAGHIFGILSGLFAAIALTAVRELRKYYSANVIILSALLAGTLMPILFMAIAEITQIPALNFMISKFVMPDLAGWGIGAILGVCGLYYQSYLTKAYAATRKAGIVATLSYTDIIFSMIFGLALGDMLPNFTALCGIALIIAAGILIANRR
ncbi:MULTISPECIES: DMT family transporter [unclassified Campylobacter]|uniref:DMT family transporter n=1 Tax=unclassified Campylobacter TaxID=2593542 RepID=UPI0022E9C737|nr:MULTISPECIES: DMT family transporter [unclassified Campylobacter]MDA3062789.1 DMT family transporter [Campylobacter sp. JMF_14 EL1]MDA3073683.1 DMT family transporter [Campylobacter sp. JMF_10 EL2]